MVLIQILLPALPRDPEPDLASAFTTTRRELIEKFNGLTAYTRAPAKGAWTADDGHTEFDDVVMVEVITDAFDRSWWRDYASTLAKRFRQQEIHVRALSIDTPGGD